MLGRPLSPGRSGSLRKATWRAGFLEEGALTCGEGSLKDQDEPRAEIPLESRHLNARTDLKGDISV